MRFFCFDLEADIKKAIMPVTTSTSARETIVMMVALSIGFFHRIKNQFLYVELTRLVPEFGAHAG